MNSTYSIHHICPFIAKNQLGGHSYSVPALCESISEKIDTHLHVTNSELNDVANNLIFDPSFIVHEYKTNPLLKPILSSKKFKSNLKKIVKDGDIIHNHGLWRMPNIYPLLAKEDNHITIIVSPKGSLSKAALNISKCKKYIFKNISRQNELLKKCDSFHATSIKEKNEIRILGYKQPIAIIPNGIDIPSQYKNSFNENKTKFLYLGRIYPIKGLDLLIKVWKKIDNKNASLDICGFKKDYKDLNYYKSLKKLTKKLGIKNITFSDQVSGEDKKQKFIENDVLILPSKSENFGLVIAEAMSYGLPVITSEHTPWKFLEEKKCGWIVKLNEESLLSTIKFVQDLNSSTLKKIGHNGRLLVENKYSWEKLSVKYSEYYNWINTGGNIPKFVDIF